MVSAEEKTMSSGWMRLGVGRLLRLSGKRKPLWAPALTFSDKQVLCWRGTGKAFPREGQSPVLTCMWQTEILQEANRLSCHKDIRKQRSVVVRTAK